MRSKRRAGDPENSGKGAASPLFALEATGGDPENSGSSHGSSNQYPGLDWEKLETKNKSRKKFGMQPLSPEEFLELEAQVQQLDTQQRAAAAAAAKAAAEMSKDPPRKTSSFFDKVLGNVLPKDTCETNWDCERPEVCCDFGFQKRCCRSGSRVHSGLPQMVLVPVPIDTRSNYPPGQGPNEPPPRY